MNGERRIVAPSNPTYSRRSVVTAATVAMTGALVPSGQSGRTQPASPVATPAPTSTTADGLQPDGRWVFTDDQGRTVILPRPPERIAAFVTAGSALWDLGIRSTAIFGSVHRADGSLQPAVGEIDLTQVTIISEEYWATDLEAFVAAQPDLIVTTTWSAENPDQVWGIEAAALAQAQAIAPVIAINYGSTSLLTAVERFEALAAALGAEPDAPKVVAGAAAFDAAVAMVEAAIAGKPDLTTLWVAGEPDGLWVCGPAGYADLAFFAELGLTILDVAGGTGADLISWESVGDFTADVVFSDARETGAYYTPEELMAQPTMSLQPAVQARQIEPWYYEYVLSRAGFTTILQELALALERSRKVTPG